MKEKEKLTEFVLTELKRSNGEVKLYELAKYLKIKSDSDKYQLLKKVLLEMVSEGVIIRLPRQKYLLNDYTGTSTLSGKVSIQKGRGFVSTESADFPVIGVKMNNLNSALDGDKVIVKLLGIKKGKKPRGEIIKITERSLAEFAGRLQYDGFFYFIVPDDEKYYVDFLVPPELLMGAEQGDIVLAKFRSWENTGKSPVAEIVKIIGKAGDPTAEYDSVLLDFELPFEFPHQVLAEADAFSENISAKESERRKDLRKDTIFTIDPEDARDFDDAVSLRKNGNGNHVVGIHIADVSHYVRENSNLDYEADMRGTSVYLVDRVVPMLPERLSNNICSLKPETDRLTFSVEAELDENCNLVKYDIFESVINSKKRFSYNEVQEIIENEKGEFCDKIFELNKIAQKLKSKRLENGGINFETSEVRFVLDERKMPVKAYMKSSTSATSLIEELMLLANKIVASHIKILAENYGRTKLPYIYRIHERPETPKIQRVLGFLRTLGIKYKTKDIDSKKINSIISSFKDKPEKYLINQILIRAMAKAEYSTKNVGHFGLGFDYYTHFTSPIRRYPDLLVHRLIKNYSSMRTAKDDLKIMKIKLKDKAKRSSQMERNAIDAERQAQKLASSLLAQNEVGNTYYGTISGVTNFGIFVLMDDLYAEGLLHIKDIYDDYYDFDENNFCLTGRRSKKKFAFGDRINVRIINVDIERKSIDLALVENNGT